MIDNEQFLSISRSLEKHHAVFYALWEMGKPIFTDKIETAAVAFDKEGQCVNFFFNPKFWEDSDEVTRNFVICHECLHVVLKHGLRTRDGDNPRKCNIALDVVVNHTLTRGFEFNRNDIQNWEQYCWVETVFPDNPVPSDQAFEFYYKLMPESETLRVVLVEGGDGHAGLEGDWSDVINKLNEKLSNEEKAALKDMIEKHSVPSEELEGGQTAGTEEGGRWTFVNVGVVQKKKKWETVIKQWSKKFDRSDMQDVEQWARMNRRFACMGGDLMLPTEMEVEHESESRIQVWFFQDTSGSCGGFIDRFFKAALSLDPKRFDVKMHCFDTRVYETTLESKKLFGFGGTSFQPIENYIQRYIKDSGESYPKAVFIITDGYGSPVSPEKPENWFWFLSSQFTHYIPEKSHTFMLRDYE